MTKIEEVARAICIADGVDPDAVGYGLGAQMPKDVEYPLWKARVAQARAAIRAMREPNEAMIESSYKAGEMKSCNSPEEAKALFRSVLWPAAVDAILEEKA